MADNDQDGGARLEAEAAPPTEGPTSVVIAVGLLVVSAMFTIGGFRVPVPEGWQTAPGMLPIIIGGSLFIMSAALLIKALAAGALKVSITEESGDKSLKLVVIALVLIGVFYFGLLSLLPFEVAATLFLLAMLWVFWPEGSWPTKLAVAIGIPILITLCFQALFGIPLPGQGNLVLGVQYIWVTW